ncbi:hypothetical protein ROBYS_00370 [Roseobacter sp. OBYS 0001]|nr:hypothetical protein ROBYS_00370 [Roseobacter sp. OBYS 0001]
MKSDVNPIDPTQRLRDAPRCSATAKSTGERCRNPSKQNWNVCRLHGAGGGAPRGKAHPNHRHGLRTKEMQDLRRMVSVLSKSAGELDQGFL